MQVVNNEETHPTITQGKNISQIDVAKTPAHNSSTGNTKEVSPIKTPQNVPLPPAVPTSWLKLKQSTSDKPLEPPKICVQSIENIEREPVKMDIMPAPPAPAIANQQIAVDPQPSCSFAPVPPPVQASQLKPDKQTKEVEVSP